MEYAREHNEYTGDGGLYSHGFSLRKITDKSLKSPRGILNWFKKIALMDEYDELNVSSRGRISGVAFLFFFGAMIYFLCVAGFVGFSGESDNILWVNLIPSIILGVILLRLFPSILYLSRQTTIHIQDIIYSLLGKTLPKETSAFSYKKLDPSGRDLEFIKSLSEIGSPEIEQLYLSYVNLITKETKVRNNLSRIVSALLAVSILFSYWLTNPLNIAKIMQDFGFWACPIALGLFGIWGELILAVEYRLKLGRLHRVQVDQDRKAGDLSLVLQAEDFKDKALPSNFCLYLRPFITTDKIHIGEMDLETNLAYSISRVSSMIALGHPGEHIGAGRIKTSDEHWQEEIIRLIDNAKLIFIIPSHREGTLWEIKNLRQGQHLSKTIFVMPPNIMFENEPYEMQWKQALEASLDYGVQLPPHLREGLFFRMDAKGTMTRQASLGVEEFIINTLGPS